MPHEKHPPKGWYRVVVLLKREWTNVDHNLGGRRAFELVQQWREAGYMAHYVNQGCEHAASAANTCPDCAWSLVRWKQRRVEIVKMEI